MFGIEGGIEAGANGYTHPTTAGNKHIPSGGSTGKYLNYGGSSGAAYYLSSFDNKKSSFVIVNSKTNGIFATFRMYPSGSGGYVYLKDNDGVAKDGDFVFMVFVV